MYILIPADIKDKEEAKITLIDDAKVWHLLEFYDGRVHKYEYFDKKEDISEFIEVIIVKDQNEYVWPYMEEGIAVLVAPIQLYVEDVMEAFLFKELHDLNIGN